MLSEALNKNSSHAVLFGAVAMGLYGYQRNTLDLDFLLPSSDFDNFTRVLQSIGYEQVLQTVQYAKFRHKKEIFMDIDAVFINDDSAEKIIASSQLKESVSGAVFL